MPISACQHSAAIGNAHNRTHVICRKSVAKSMLQRNNNQHDLYKNAVLFNLEKCNNASSLLGVHSIKCKNNISKALFLLVLLARIKDSGAPPATTIGDVNIFSKETPLADRDRIDKGERITDSVTMDPVKANPDSRLSSLPSELPSMPPSVTLNDIYEIRNHQFNHEVLKLITGSPPIIDNTDLDPVIIFIPNQEDNKRIKRRLIEQPDHENDTRPTLNEQCHIRTKNNQGTVLGDSVLLSGEYLRNPIRGIAEQIYKKGTGGHEMPEGLVLFTEGANTLYDVVLSLMTAIAYPIVKYGTAKLLKASAHGVNGELECLKYEFSPQELANLLFDTETGITHRRAFVDFSAHPKPSELKSVRRFVPDGVFVQENVNTGINSVKYMKVTHQGTDYLVREKSPGEYYTLHPGAMKPEFLERKIYFDSVNNKIHFREDMPTELGMNYDVVDGKKFIHIYNENHEINYNWDKRLHEVVLKGINGDSVSVPVYMEPLTRSWHFSTHNDIEVFTHQEKNIIDNIHVDKNPDSSYIPEINYTPRVYGSGKIFREKANGDVYGYTKQSLIEMNGSLVPVKEIVVPERGVRYAVYDAKGNDGRTYPVEWDGRRWVFESSTSLHVSSGLKKIIAKMNNQRINVDKLSAADDQGLRWDGNDSYIKINDQYIKLNKFKNNRFYIDNEDGVSKIFLRFDNGKFSIEDASERLKRVLDVDLSERASRARTAEDILSKIDGLNEVSAREILTQYKFPDNSLYTKEAFALDVEQYGVIPLWAENFRIKAPDVLAEPSSGLLVVNQAKSSVSKSSTESILSSISSTPDTPVPRSNIFLRTSDLPPDSSLNERGMIERRNFQKLYRVETMRRMDKRGGPQAVIERGFFSNSIIFAGPKRMMDGDIVITSRTIEGATRFGEVELEGNYYLFEIEAVGRRGVSLNENVEINTAFTELRENYDAGSIAQLKQNNQLHTFAENAHSFDEVHLDNSGEPMSIRLIKTQKTG